MNLLKQQVLFAKELLITKRLLDEVIDLLNLLEFPTDVKNEVFEYYVHVDDVMFNINHINQLDELITYLNNIQVVNSYYFVNSNGNLENVTFEKLLNTINNILDRIK